MHTDNIPQGMVSVIIEIIYLKIYRPSAGKSEQGWLNALAISHFKRDKVRYYKPDNVKTRFIKMTLLFLPSDFAVLELIWIVVLWAGQAREEWDAIISCW